MGLGESRPLCSASALCAHTKYLEPGALFYVLGEFDFLRFQNDLENAKLLGIVCETSPEIDLGLPIYLVENSRETYLKDCQSFYRDLFSCFDWVAVTGTKGKTSIAYLLYKAFEHLKTPVAYIGTLGIFHPGGFEKSANTTPGLQGLIELCKKLSDQGVKRIIIEASSQGLEQYRLPVDFIQDRIFTDLSEEHLDAHGTMQEYFRQKMRLFQGAEYLKSPPRAFLLNRSSYSKEIAKGFAGDVIYYGMENGGAGSSIELLEFQEGVQGSQLKIRAIEKDYDVHMNGFGFFQVENFLACVEVLSRQLDSLEDLKEFFLELPGVPGRLERVCEHHGAGVYVDYAHSAQALEFVLQTGAELSKGSLILVFGCGGDRDRAKRPRMGKAAEKYADLCILTNDNPRSEEPDKILKEILKGFENRGAPKIVPDREEAIRVAMSELKPGDVMLVCGKGHEDYQIEKGVVRHFSDHEIILKIHKGSP